MKVAEVEAELDLFGACRVADLGRVKELLEIRADVNQVNAYGGTPFEIALLNGHAEVVQLLIQAGAYKLGAAPCPEWSDLRLEVIVALMGGALNVFSTLTDERVKAEIVAFVRDVLTAENILELSCENRMQLQKKMLYNIHQKTGYPKDGAYGSDGIKPKIFEAFGSVFKGANSKAAFLLSRLHAGARSWYFENLCSSSPDAATPLSAWAEQGGVMDALACCNKEGEKLLLALVKSKGRSKAADFKAVFALYARAFPCLNSSKWVERTPAAAESGGMAGGFAQDTETAADATFFTEDECVALTKFLVGQPNLGLFKRLCSSLAGMIESDCSTHSWNLILRVKTALSNKLVFKKHPYTQAKLNFLQKLGNVDQFIRACREGDIGYVEKNITSAKLSGVDECGNSALHIALEYGRIEMVRLLIAKGGDVHRADRYGNTPIYNTRQRGSAEVVAVLHDAKADINHVNAQGCTPLWYASRRGNDVTVAALLTAKADVHKADEDGNTPLHVAASWAMASFGYDKVVSLLVSAGAGVNTVAPNGSTPLCQASRGPAYVVAALLAKGADVNKVDHEKNTPLFIASKSGYVDVMSLLVGVTPEERVYPAIILLIKELRRERSLCWRYITRLQLAILTLIHSKQNYKVKKQLFKELSISFKGSSLSLLAEQLSVLNTRVARQWVLDHRASVSTCKERVMDALMSCDKRGEKVIVNFLDHQQQAIEGGVAEDFSHLGAVLDLCVQAFREKAEEASAAPEAVEAEPQSDDISAEQQNDDVSPEQQVLIDFLVYREGLKAGNSIYKDISNALSWVTTVETRSDIFLERLHDALRIRKSQYDELGVPSNWQELISGDNLAATLKYSEEPTKCGLFDWSLIKSVKAEALKKQDPSEESKQNSGP